MLALQRKWLCVNLGGGAMSQCEEPLFFVDWVLLRVQVFKGMLRNVWKDQKHSFGGVKIPLKTQKVDFAWYGHFRMRVWPSKE